MKIKFNLIALIFKLYSFFTISTELEKNAHVEDNCDSKVTKLANGNLTKPGKKFNLYELGALMVFSRNKKLSKNEMSKTWPGIKPV